MKRAIIGVLVAGVLGLGTEVVTIPDPGLEGAIRAALGKPSGDLTTHDLERLVELEALGWEIEELTGLEHAVNLRTLDG